MEVADSTVEKDRTFKKVAYASAGITEYWIVNIPARQVEQYLQPIGESYQLGHIYKASQSLESPVAGTVRVIDILP
ncbi:MAG: Uma2 family endonuclease [Phaeodactylibacter sp.]|nr:Uma2 family endonuclease [Phaeodactylibacter sp.]MCB9300800.1 Uma2 family endonuclease [Lewinellaceae bacterium]HQU60385.1 Uma2 family endonuclease [Saprospiraceae bacterium]